jgi:hypothetical protein
MLAGVGLLMVCCSSLSAFMMSGEETPNPDPKGGANDSGTGANDSGTGADDSETGADDSGTGTDTDPDTTTQAMNLSALHTCVQSERNWIKGKMRNDGWTQYKGEIAMSCRMTDTELEPCNVAETNWINAVIEQGTHSPSQAERAMNGCRR